MHILVVEDDLITRKRLCRLLENAGHHVRECPDGSSAMNAFMTQAEPPDIIVTDWMMPEMDGLHLAQSIRSLTTGQAYVYIILLTSRNEATDKIDGCTTGGVDDYIVKPFSVEELLARIHVGERVIKLERSQRNSSHRLEAIVRKQTRQLRETQEEVVDRLLSALECRDLETGTHVRRIGRVSALLATALGWNTARTSEMRVAAAMHDIGKVGVPDAVLQKPGRLTPDAYALMQRHTLIDAAILANSRFSLIEIGREVCLGHHEKWDGTGYPPGLAGEAIPQCARIMAVADVYDALINDRVYRPALPQEQTLAILHEGRGRHFDPAILDLFFENLDTVTAIYRHDASALPPPKPE